MAIDSENTRVIGQLISMRLLPKGVVSFALQIPNWTITDQYDPENPPKGYTDLEVVRNKRKNVAFEDPFLDVDVERNSIGKLIGVYSRD